MKIFDKDEKLGFESAVCLGNFDGIHIGHQKIIEVLKTEAADKKLKTVMLTFKIHPENFIENGSKTKLITSEEIKFEILSELGMDVLYLHEFDEQTKDLSAESFVENILINKMNAKVLVAGFNYRFGKGREGDSDTLKQLGERSGIKVSIVPAVYHENRLVSSTLIRGYLSMGDIEKVNVLLKRAYAILGQVSEGKRKGRELGFPTANLIPIPEIMYPQKGVYLTKTYYEGKEGFSVTNIGVNPTVGGIDTIIETHIIGAGEELYGKNIKIEFYKKIRDEKNFKSIDQLRAQITEDIDIARRYFDIEGSC
jgi:riboflavin kinase / FMN adenylyltransferase